MTGMISTLPGFYHSTRVSLASFMTKRRWAKRVTILIPAIILITIVASAVFAPLLSAHSPSDQDLSARYQPPFWLSGGDTSHLLGTDELGRDVFVRVLYGARTSLIFAFLAIGLGGITGTALGIIAGYSKSWPDMLISRLIELFMAIPSILLAILASAVFGPSFLGLAVVVSVLLWTFYARQIRAETLSLRGADFVVASRAVGCPPWRTMMMHVFPNTIPSVIVLASLNVGQVILLESSLSFLGAGLPLSYTTWGQMVSGGQSVLETAWWVSAFPGLAIALTVLSLNLVGDWLRDRLDPKLRGKEG